MTFFFNWPLNILAGRCWWLNYSKSSECENCPHQGYIPSFTGLICSPQHQHLQIHSDTFQLFFQSLFLFFICKTIGPHMLKCRFDCSAFALDEWQIWWNQIPDKGHQLSSCSLTAVGMFWCPDIDCRPDIWTFALNQACSGKGLLIRHPFKNSTPTLTSCVMFEDSSSSSYYSAWWSCLSFFFFFWFDYQSERVIGKPFLIFMVESYKVVGLFKASLLTVHCH